MRGNRTVNKDGTYIKVGKGKEEEDQKVSNFSIILGYESCILYISTPD